MKKLTAQVNLVVDFGNTRTKAAIFEDTKMIFKTDTIALKQVAEMAGQYNPHHIIVSSVKLSRQQVEDNLHYKFLWLDHTTHLPFAINYKTPETLGLDRIAAVAGAHYLYPNKNCLVIDAGTCITYDIIDHQSVYHGGAISPGLNMRFKALNTFTANLPLVNHTQNIPLIGASTNECIESGVVNGLVGEIQGFIRMYSDKFADLQIIMCGGDAKFFENSLKEGIFATPELVLTGLNRILQYNV